MHSRKKKKNPKQPVTNSDHSIKVDRVKKGKKLFRNMSSKKTNSI